MNVALWIVQFLLALLYVLAGWLKLFVTSRAQKDLAWARRHSVNFVRFIGAVELLGALGLVLPMLTGILTWLTPLAAVGLFLIQVLAIFTEHLPAKEYKAIPLNVLWLLLAAFVAYGRFFAVPR